MDQIEKLRRKKREIVEGAPADVKQRLFFDKGMFPPRERIEKLLDPGTFFSMTFARRKVLLTRMYLPTVTFTRMKEAW